MANTISPNMNLIIPGVGTEAGPTYATDINSSLTLIDGHTHASGSGVPITPAAININAALPMNNNIINSIAALTLIAQTSAPASQSLYVSGVDLHYIDGNGNNIPITASGAVTGSSGTITGLPSGTASATYSGGTFTFQSATNTSAVIDGQSHIFRNNTASSKGLTLLPPTAMTSDFSLVLPNIPAQTNVMTLDTDGNMGSITYDAVGQNMTSAGANAILTTFQRSTGSSVAALGVAVSGSSGGYVASNTTITAVTSLQVTIVTTGKPVWIGCISDGSASIWGSITGATCQAYIYRGGTSIAAFQSTVSQYPGTTVSTVDVVAAGTYTYTIQMNCDPGGSYKFLASKLVAYELL